MLIHMGGNMSTRIIPKQLICHKTKINTEC